MTIKNYLTKSRGLFRGLCSLLLVLGLWTTNVNAQTVIIGSGVTTASGVNGAPIYRSSATSAFHHSKSIQLITAAQLATAGVTSGADITSWGYNKQNNGQPAGANGWTLNVYLKNTSNTVLTSGTTWTTMISGATLGYTATITSANMPAALGYWNWPITGFNYTGGAIECYIEWFPATTMTSPFTTNSFLWQYTASGNQAMGTSSSVAIPGTQSAWTTQARFYNTQISYSTGPCAGTPAPGNTVSTANPACPSAAFTLSLQNSTSGSGVTYQWQTSPDDITYSNAGGASTNATYTTSQATATYYRAEVTCSAGPNTGYSNSLQVTMNPFTNCYCAASFSSPTTDEDLSNVTVGTLNNSSTCGVLAPGPGSVAGSYSNFKTSVAAPDLTQSATVSFSITVQYCGTIAYQNVVAIYIDYNQNGLFDEAAAFTSTYAAGTFPTRVVAGTFNVPAGATLGNTVMRVVVNESTTAAACGSPIGSWGEAEDYLVNIVAAVNCSGMPNTGTVSPATATICGTGTSTFSLTGASSGTGISYQWQQNVNGAGYSDIAGATNLSYTTPTLNTAQSIQFQVITTCSFSSSSTSSAATLTVYTAATVSPTSASFCPGGSQLLTASPGGASYLWSANAGSATTQSVTATAGGTYTVTVTQGGTCTTTATATITVNPSVTINSVTATPGTICSGSTSALNVSASGPAFSYCAASATTGCGSGDEYISNVTFGTINNTTACGGTTYSNFTAQSNTVTAGASGLTLTYGNPNYFSGDQYKVYIDWNQNGTLNDAGEEFTGTGTTTLTFSINVPAGALNGTTRMRVRLFYTGSTLPCGVSSYGETEDYSVVVTGGIDPFTYAWSPSAGLTPSATVSNPTTPALTTTTPYTVVVTNATGCTASGNTTVNVNAHPTGDLSGTQSICSGGTATLSIAATGSGTISGTLNPGAIPYSGTAPTITVNVTPGAMTSYSIASMSDANCTSDPGDLSGGATVSIYTTATAPATVTSDDPDNEICAGNSIMLTANGGAFGDAPSSSYKWYEGGCGTGSALSSVATLTVTPSVGTHTYYARIEDACGNTSCASLTVLVTGAPPANTVGTPAAPSEACSGSVSLITVNAVGGPNIQYSWTTGSGSGVVMFSDNIGGPFSPAPFLTATNQVYAQFGAVAGGQSGYSICVQGTNSCGSTNNKCVFIRGKVSVPGTITPASNSVACQNDVKSYVAGASGGATVYNWTLNGSTTPITSGQGTTNATVTYPAGFAGGSLCVTASLSCGGSSTSAPRCMTVTNAPAIPAPIAGPSSICPGSTGVSFSIPAVTGASGYNWTTPAGTTITSGQNTTSITVSFPPTYSGAPPVCVSATSACASSVARCKTVGSAVPGQPGAISGPTTNICNSTVQYSIASVTSANGPTPYTWTNPAGTTITSGQYSTTIQLQVGPTFVSGTLSVTANTNLCSPGTSPARAISIYGRPTTPTAITAAPGSWCNGAIGINFSATPGSYSPAVTYNWSVTQGTITAGQGTNNIDVDWGTGTGNVIVSASNLCGSNSPKTQSFTGMICREEGISSATAFSVYPNPAHDKVTVSIDVNKNANFTLQLMDISGRVLVSENISGLAGLNTYDLDLSHVAKGVYMLEVKSANDNWKSKVVVE